MLIYNLITRYQELGGLLRVVKLLQARIDKQERHTESS